jgi:nucleoside-diphosphate-sugar epimerase
MTAPILITGTPGWLGTRVVQLLLGKVQEPSALSQPSPTTQIRCLVMPGVDPSPLPASERLELVVGDLRARDQVEAFCQEAAGATLFHCAGLVHPARYVRDLYDVNVQGTRHLLEAAERAGIRRAIVISSNSPVGTNHQRDHLFDEDSPYDPYMRYGHSKMLMERVVHEIQARGELETVILRPAWFYGPGQPERQTTFFRMIRKGTVPLVGSGENVRSMSYIDHVCQAMLLCRSNPVANGQTYWIADRRPYSMNEIIDTIEQLMEVELGLRLAHRRLRLPSMASEVARLSDGLVQQLGLYHQKLHVLSEMNKNIACSIDKAKRDLGYSPTIELEEGMRRSLAWCLANGIEL